MSLSESDELRLRHALVAECILCNVYVKVYFYLDYQGGQTRTEHTSFSCGTPRISVREFIT